MFLGKYKHTLDDKGRIFMPAKFRDELAGGMVATIGIDRCISVYTKEEFSRFKDRLDGASVTNQAVRQFSRIIYGFACECECDKQGRIMLSQELKDYAGIEKEAMIVGESKKIEIWNVDKWDEKYNIEAFSMDEIAENLSQFGL